MTGRPAWAGGEEQQQLGAHGALERVRGRAHELLAIEGRAQPHHVGRVGQRGRLLLSHGVDLPANGVARDGAARPALGHQRAQPELAVGKQGMRRVQR